jgi:hypothetical protein
MLGDNIYGSERPQDFDKKFVRPYKVLLDSDIEFNAALGNHDDPNQRYFKPFNLGGNRYRTFKKGNVRFFVIDSNYLDPEQLKWLEKELSASGSDWKIAYFHHPMYTTARRGPEVEVRAVLEPLFVKHGVDVVFTGHEHIYERLNPQKGIYHFTVGGAAKLRKGDTHPSPLLAARFDRDRSFLLAEIAGDSLYFQAVSRTGLVVDKGVLARREVRPGATTTAAPGKQPNDDPPPDEPAVPNEHRGWASPVFGHGSWVFGHRFRFENREPTTNDSKHITNDWWCQTPTHPSRVWNQPTKRAMARSSQR